MQPSMLTAEFCLVSCSRWLTASFLAWTRSGRWWDWPVRDVVTLAAVQLPLTRSGANVAY